jgi:hypothetical protein
LRAQNETQNPESSHRWNLENPNENLGW